MQVNIRQTFGNRNRQAILIVLLITLTGLLVGCGDSTSTTAPVTTVATSAILTSQTTSVTQATSQMATTSVPANMTTGQAEALFEDRSTPQNLVKAFYNAINRKEYQRAYSYWQVTNTPNTPASFDQFSKGYTNTTSVTFSLGQIQQDEGAGQLYAKIPTVLVATHTDGKQESFSGCYTSHRVNKGISTNPLDELWGFTGGILKLESAGVQPNSKSCTAF